MRNLYLIRHGTPNFTNGEKLCIGRTNIDIGEIGIREAQNLQSFFDVKNINNIFASPLDRCVHTAKIIANGKCSVRVNKDLMEIFMGHWEGVPLKDIKKNLGDEPGDGEKRVDALARMENGILNILQETSGDVICVAHAGVNCAFIAKITGKDIKTSRAIKQPCGCYNHFVVDEIQHEEQKDLVINTRKRLNDIYRIEAVAIGEMPNVI